jgi:uncharacterized protein YecE (DUF72 family)
MIRVGIGGWQYPPWRGVFYPADLRHDRELAFASRELGSIEINATFYRTQKPESFRHWRDETPDDFVFSVKAPRYLSYRQTFDDDGPSMARFFESGLAELGPKLGPILWQLPPARRFDENTLAVFLELLPRHLDGRPLRHVIEAQHASFAAPRCIELLRAHRVGIALVDAKRHAGIGDVTADFFYARLQCSVETEPAGYPAAAIDAWAQRLRTLAAGDEPHDLARFHAKPADATTSRDCFVYFIGGAKLRAPTAAMALIKAIGISE